MITYSIPNQSEKFEEEFIRTLIDLITITLTFLMHVNTLCLSHTVNLFLYLPITIVITFFMIDYLVKNF